MFCLAALVGMLALTVAEVPPARAAGVIYVRASATGSYTRGWSARR
jgi:hypothetical protein